MRIQHAKPVRLEINNSCAWKIIGYLDAADDEQADLVMDAAERLVLTLHNSETRRAARRCASAPTRRCPSC